MDPNAPNPAPETLAGQIKLFYNTLRNEPGQMNEVLVMDLTMAYANALFMAQFGFADIVVLDEVVEQATEG